MERGSKLSRRRQPKVNGGHATGACWAPWWFTKMADLFHHTLDLQSGPTWDGRGSMCMETQHPNDWVSKIEWRQCNGRMPRPTEVHWDRWLHCMPLPQRGLLDVIKTTSIPGSSWFWHCGIELFAGVQIRPVGLSKVLLKWVPGQALTALFTL